MAKQNLSWQNGENIKLKNKQEIGEFLLTTDEHQGADEENNEKSLHLGMEVFCSADSLSSAC